MNVIHYTAEKTTSAIRFLANGTIFKYLDGNELYMKLEPIRIDQVAYVKVVQLKTGETYNVSLDKEVCPLPINTKITMEVNSNNYYANAKKCAAC